MSSITPDISMGDIGGSASDFAKSLNTNENNALNNYTMAQRAQAKPLDIYTSLENSAGLPEMKQTASTLRGQVGNLEDAIYRVEPDVTAKTGNSIVTEAQRQGMINAAQYPMQRALVPITNNLSRLETNIQAAGSDIANKTGLVLQGNQMALDPYQRAIDLAQNQDNRAMTGFTQDQQTQLNLLIDKLQRDRYLSDREWQQTADLAKIKQQQQYQPYSMYGGVIDTQTGKNLTNNGQVMPTLNYNYNSSPTPAPNNPQWFNTSTNTNQSFNSNRSPLSSFYIQNIPSPQQLNLNTNLDSSSAGFRY